MSLSNSLRLAARRNKHFHGEARSAIANLSISIVFTAAITLSAVLIFWIEPLFPKIMLPVMGDAGHLGYRPDVLSGGPAFGVLLQLPADTLGNNTGAGRHSPYDTRDGRMLLAGEQQKFDLIVLDAFSSDAIPIHLLTVEAFAMYLDKLRPDGMIVANIPNRFVNLNLVVSAVAMRLALAAGWRPDGTMCGLVFPSKWVALARTLDIIAPLLDRTGWTRLQPNSTQPWTDDRADLSGLLLSGP